MNELNYKSRLMQSLPMLKNMELLSSLYKEIIGFFNINEFIDILNAGDYASLLTIDGIKAMILPIIPLLLVLELIMGLIYKNPQMKVYKMVFINYVFNRFINQVLAIGMVGICIGLFEPLAIFHAEKITWYYFIYGYIVWELGHFAYHYFGHKVRLFWCLHAPHHAPEEMNLSVIHAAHFLQAPYASFIRTTVCMLLGVNPTLLFAIMFIDGTYGSFIHIGDNLIKNARFGFLEKYMLTPSHHRVHHARNPLYIDTNYCNLLNIWDRIFKTYQEEKKEVKIEYGITRPINTSNFIDFYFGDFILLFKDVYKAPGLLNKLRYIFMPPGWHHSGEHRTAKIIKEEFFDQNPQYNT